MKIKGAWNVPEDPGTYVAELENGDLKWFYIMPFRKISNEDLTHFYVGEHPRKLNGVPMPEHLYQFYGFEKVDSGLSEVIKIRVTPKQLERLKAMGKPSVIVRWLIDKELEG